MSEINDGGAAFPLQGLMLNPKNMEDDKAKGWIFTDPNNGMSLRDWFAGRALTGMCLDIGSVETNVDTAYSIANAMIERRKRL